MGVGLRRRLALAADPTAGEDRPERDARRQDQELEAQWGVARTRVEARRADGDESDPEDETDGGVYARHSDDPAGPARVHSRALDCYRQASIYSSGAAAIPV